MTDSNIQPPDTGAGLPDSVVPGTDVTYTTPAGLYPETTGDINIGPLNLLCYTITYSKD